MLTRCLRWCSNSVMIFITFFSYYYFTRKYCSYIQDSFKQILGRASKISQLSNTYNPNYKELEIKLLGTFFSSMMDYIHLKLDINATNRATKCSGHFSI